MQASRRDVGGRCINGPWQKDGVVVVASFFMTRDEEGEVSESVHVVVGEMGVLNVVVSVYGSFTKIMAPGVAPTGYVVAAPADTIMPSTLIKDSLFSYCCASEFVPAKPLDSGVLHEFLEKNFLSVPEAYRLTQDALFGENTFRDAKPWIETLGNVGVAGFYRGDGDRWLAFVMISEPDVAVQFARDYRVDFYSRKRQRRLTMSQFISDHTCATIRGAVRRCGRRVLARMLGVVAPGAFSTVPDGRAVAAPQQTPDMSPMAFLFASFRTVPQLALPQYEQEFDTFVKNDDTVHYHCGVVPSACVVGRPIVACEGRAKRLRLLDDTWREKVTHDVYLHPYVSADDDSTVCRTPECCDSAYAEFREYAALRCPSPRRV